MTETQPKPDALVLLSGGIDSTTVLYEVINTLNKTPIVLVAQYGQKHSREIDCALYHAHVLNTPLILTPLADLFSNLDIQSALTSEDIAVPELDDVLGDPQPPTYVPNRNQFLLAIAAAVAESMGINNIYIGTQKTDMYGYWDATPEFINRLNAVYELNRKNKIKIVAPFADYSKTEIVNIGINRHQIDYRLTWSCYKGGALACGQCATCRERLKAFENNGCVDPIGYEGMNHINDNIKPSDKA